MSKKSDQEILRLARERFQEAYDADQGQRTEADEDIRFGINDEGCQWDPVVRDMREGDDPPRPCLVINLIPEKIDQTEGEFRQAEISYKVRPVDSKGDKKTADIMAGMLRAIEYDSKAKNAYNTSMNSTLYGGRGGWRWNVVEDEDNPWVKSLKISRISNIFTLYWDPYAKELDKSDARYWFCTEIVPKEEFKDKYGDEAWDEWSDDDQWENWLTEDGRRIAEYWWKEDEEITYYKVDRGGKEEVVEKLGLDDMVIEEKKVKRPKIRWCKMTAGAILEGVKKDWPSKLFPFVLQVGKEVVVRGISKTRGKVRFAKEPMQLYNYAVSSITETFSMAPKAPYLVEADMIADYKHIWDKLNVKNFPYLPFKRPAVNPQAQPSRVDPPAINPSMFNVLAILEHNLMSAMGRYQAALGDKGDEKSGKAIFARQGQGVTGDAVYTDNFNMALQHSCRIGISLIPHVYDTERIIRIIGEDGIEKEVPVNTSPATDMGRGFQGQLPPELWNESEEGLVNDLSVGRYDVRVTVGPSYGTQRQEALEMLVELVGRVPQIGPAVLDLIAENMDLPRSQELIRRLKKLVPVEIRGLEEGEQPPPPPPPDPKLMLEMEKLALDFREIMRKEFDSHFKAIGVVAQAESLEAGQQLEQYTSSVDRYQKQIELEQQQQELQQQAQQAKAPGGAQ